MKFFIKKISVIILTTGLVASSGLNVFADEFGFYDTGTTYPMYDTGTTYPTYDTGTTYPMYDTGTTYPTYSTGTTYPTYDTGTTYPTYSTGTTYPTYDTGTTYPTYSTGTTYPTYSTGTTYPTYDTGTTYPTYSTGTTYPTYDTGTTYPTYSTGTTYPTYSTGTTYPTYSTGTTYPTYSTGTTYPTYDTGTTVTPGYTFTPGYTYTPATTVIGGGSTGYGSTGYGYTGGVGYSGVGYGSTGYTGGISYPSTSWPGYNYPTNPTTPITQCPVGQNLINNICVPVTQCPAGQTLVNNICVPVTRCPTGQTLVGNICQPVAQCPAGTTLVNNICQPVTQCPAGSTLVNGVCQAPINCPLGTNYINGVCVPVVINNNYTCPNGTVVSYASQCPIIYTPPVYTPPTYTVPTYTFPTYTNSNYSYGGYSTTQVCWDGTTIPTYATCASQYKVCANGTSIPINQTCFDGINNSYLPVVAPPVVKFNNVVTSIVTEITNKSARCNGIGLIANRASSTGWFEYGETSNLGRSTAQASIGNYSTAPFSNVLTNLKPSTSYFCRAVMQNQYGIVKGEIVKFTTKSKTTVYVKPVVTVKKTTTTTKTVTKKNQIICTDGSIVTVGSQSVADMLNQGKKLMSIQIEKTDGSLSRNSAVSYKLSYKNLTDARLTGVTVKIILPKEISFVSSTNGTYEGESQTLTYDIGSINTNQEGSIVLVGKVERDAIIAKSIVVTGYGSYNVPGTKVDDEVSTYVVGSIVPEVDGSKVDMGAKKVIGSGVGSFLPDNLVEWLALIAILFIIIILGRSIYASYKEEDKTLI